MPPSMMKLCSFAVRKLKTGVHSQFLINSFTVDHVVVEPFHVNNVSPGRI